MLEIKKILNSNSEILFKHKQEDVLAAIFDSKGFYLSQSAAIKYNIIKNEPHIYVAWTKDESGFYYVGKSFQKGGRWKRQHAYHLGTLAYHLNNSIRHDDQNHLHWIEKCMNTNKINKIDLPKKIKTIHINERQ
jgi:hypothetical protein